MLEKIENALKDLVSLLQVIKLYTAAHPRFRKFLDKSFESLKNIFINQQEVVIGIVGDEFVFEKEIFFEFSKIAKPIIDYLRARGVEKIIFSSGVQKEELEKFVEFLAIDLDKEETRKNSQEALYLAGVRNIALGKLGSSGAGDTISAAAEKSISYLSLYESSLGQVTDSLDSVLGEQNINYLSLRFAINNIAENMAVRYNEILKLITIKRYDAGTFIHLLNVSILSMYFSTRLGFSREDVLDVGTAALFHDIGKLFISRKIIKKTDKLTEDEFKNIRSHSFLGARLLLRQAETIGILPVIVAFEHHMRQDAKSYPKPYFPYVPHIASVIVSICDVYDALAQRRSYKADYSPDVIYDLMNKDKNRFFQPKLVSKFFSIMGVWPVGTIVTLNGGRIAIVREENEDNASLPKVEVMYPPSKRGLMDLSLNQESDWIESFVNPLRQGKDFLNMV
ncbi:MAG: HD domain-containing protein [Candidatus Omnitrophota bacterium]